MSLADCNCAALRQASRSLTRAYDDALAPAGLGINQFSILARLGRLGPSVMQDLARTLVMDRSTLGHLLRPLERRGWIALETDRADARCRLVSLTLAGQTVLAEAWPLWAAAQDRFERQFGTAEAAALRDTLAAVVAASPSTHPA